MAVVRFKVEASEQSGIADRSALSAVRVGRERLETRFRGREPSQGLIAWTVLAASSQWLLRQQVPERPTIGAGGKAGE